MAGVYEPSTVEAAVAQVRAAVTDAGLVRLEGAHAVKHALRFHAEVEALVTPDRAGLLALVDALADDVHDQVAAMAVEVPSTVWDELAPRGLPSPALAVACRPPVTVTDVLGAPGRIVALERPRHLGNLGAAIRVAAAAGAGGVLVVDGPDPWHPTVVRTAAGLQYAVACAATGSLPATDRQLIALHPDGEPLGRVQLDDDAVLLVGTERAGLGPGLLTRADRQVAIPMRAGVSSLNLATAVAVALYHDLGR